MTKKSFKEIGADLFFSNTSTPVHNIDTVKDLKINPVFKALIPPLSQEEYVQLEENLLQNGVREAISVWNETIIDGHNRYEIVKKHNLPYMTMSYNFETEDDVIFWIIKNQFGRRNLSAYDRAVLALHLKPIIAERAKDNQGTRSDILQNSAESYSNIHMDESSNTNHGIDHNFPQNSAEGYSDIHMDESSNPNHDIDHNFPQNSAESYSDIHMDESSNPNHGIDSNFPQNSAESYSDIHMDGSSNSNYSIDSNFSQNSAKSIDTRKELAAIAGVSHDTISKVEKIEKLATLEIKERLKRGDISIHRAYQNINRQERQQETAVLPLKPPVTLMGTYNVIYADYPWDFSFPNLKDAQEANNRPLIKLENIKSLEVPAEDDSILFMWAASSVLDKALQVMGAWGFTYRTCAVWDKTKQNMGQWFMGQHEMLLIGTKGKFSPPPENVRVPSVYREEAGEHFEKPKYYYELIENMFPNGRYLELFTNKKYSDKWDIWSSQVLCDKKPSDDENNV